MVENQSSAFMTHAAHKAYAIIQNMSHEIPIGLGVIGFMPGLAAGLLRG